MFMQRFFVRKILQIIWKNDAGDSTICSCNSYRPVDEVADLRRLSAHMNVVARNIFEQRHQINFLLVVAANGRSRLLTNDRDNGLMIHPRIVQAIQQMNGTGARRSKANADFAGKLRMGTRHKRSHLFVTGLNKLDFRTCTIDRTYHAVNTVSRISENSFYAPASQTLDDEITNQMIARYLAPLTADGVDTLVLGCTHYPLLSAAIARSLGNKIRLVDSAKSCARTVEDLLDRQSLRASATEKGNLLVALTDAADNFLRVAREALKLELAEVKVCEIFDSSSTGCLHERK